MFRHFEERRHQEGNKQDSPSYTRLSVSELETIYLLYILLGGTRIFYVICYLNHLISLIHQYTSFEKENRRIGNRKNRDLMIFDDFLIFLFSFVFM